ncbi:DNA repair protein XRCC4 [Capsicum annuum]|uniref:DNA repair protein XRCC4 n=1 Tax=Capsicum annuum TaxID=4072 RepID=A0A1U8GWB4_CAPAN|nr:DNA repair protein XRCC4 isoform X1 [Capsicum annuum]KAF3662902.1 DNA repair protein XRCC4 [Capsicum annuum]PHT78221.1 DNA repair protein XRCC4 [Capsicum annuum]
MGSASPKQTCLKLEIPNNKDKIFVKGTWYPSYFQLFITDGLHAWTCHGSEEEVEERALQWDQPVSEYIELAEKYLGFQQPDSVYGFDDAGSGHKRLSWTFEKEGTKLEWRWKCQPSPNSQKTTADILDFLMDANIRLSDEVVDKTQSFERLRVEADKCLTQSEILSKEKEEFESAIYAKFVGVLNSKKKKLRELRDRLSKQGTSVEEPVEEDAQSTDRTETFDEGSNEEISGEEVEKEDVGTSSKKDDVGTSNPRRGRGRKRK